MPEIKREDGFYSSFCPLSLISWMREAINDAFFLVLGTTSCACFVQTPRPIRISNSMQNGTIILEESEVSLGIDETKLISLVSQVVDIFTPKVVFLLGSCFIEIQKFDLTHIADYLQKHFGILFIPVRLSGFDNSYTCGEDVLLSNLMERCPYPRDKKKELVIVGALNNNLKSMFFNELQQLGVPFGGFLPASDINNLPVLGEETLVAGIYPYLSETMQKIARVRGSKVVISLFPYGPEGIRDFYEKICAYFGLSTEKIERKESEILESLSKEMELIRGKKVFFMGDNILELPLARFLSSRGARVLEVGTPYIHYRYHQVELEELAKNKVPITEFPNNLKQLARIKELKPDLIVTPLSLSYPLEKMGFKVLWSVKFFQTGTGICGFENIPLLVRMFTNSLTI